MTTRLLVLRLLAISSALVLGACKDDVGDDVANIPAAFAFVDLNNVALNAQQTSAPVAITGINVPLPISVSGGTYAIGSSATTCGSTFVSTAGTITSGQFVCARHTSATTINTPVNTTVTIGSVSDVFTSTTADTQPDAFTFVDQPNVAQNTVRTSNAVTISGIGTAAPVTVTGGTYSVGCTATFVSTAGTITNGQTVCVRHTSAAAASTAVDTVLTVGGVSDTFTSTTGDSTPDAFTFTDRTNVGQNMPQVSNTVTITGISAPTPIAVTGGEYSIGCTASFTSANGTVNNSETVCVRHSSANAPTAAVNTALTVGGVSDTFTTTTAAAAPDFAGNVFGVTAGTSPRLVQFAANAPGIVANGANGVAITGLTGTPSILGIDFRPATGAFYALASDGRLYTVVPATGAATFVCTLIADPADITGAPAFTALSGTAQYSLDFNPVPDRLRIVGSNRDNLRVNVTPDTNNNCLTITDGLINPGTPQLVGAGYTNSVSGVVAATTLFVVNTVDDSVATQNPPNDGTLVPVGPTGVTLGNQIGFDIVRVGASDNAALMSVDGTANSTLFRVNLLSGQAFNAGVIGGGAVVTDIAIPIP
ncbi:MAG: DUF4394 domain-containing protein [Nevskiales bacterium]